MCRRASDTVRRAAGDEKHPPGAKQPPAPPSERDERGGDDLGWRRERRTRAGFSLRDYLDLKAEGGAGLRRKPDPDAEPACPDCSREDGEPTDR